MWYADFIFYLDILNLMRKFSMRFSLPNLAWNLCKPLKPMFATLILPVASVF